MSSLDDFAVYVFVRQDLSEQDQRIQIAHAVLKMAIAYQPAEANYAIVELDGGESKKAFDRTVRKMPERGVAHVIYQDSDCPEWGDTAIATIPLSGRPLPHKLRRNSPPASPRLAVDEKSSGEPIQNASVAQETEHSTFSREVVGEIPTGSSIQTCHQSAS